MAAEIRSFFVSSRVGQQSGWSLGGGFFGCLVLGNTRSHLAAGLDRGIAQVVLTAWNQLSARLLPLRSLILKEDNHSGSQGHKEEKVEAARPLETGLQAM